MRSSVSPDQTPRKAENVQDLQAQLYREIGISAVAAALRFVSQPDPTKRRLSAGADTAPQNLRPDDIAA